MTSELLNTCPDQGCLLAFVILLDEHLYGGLIFKSLAEIFVEGIRAWRAGTACTTAKTRDECKCRMGRKK